MGTSRSALEFLRRKGMEAPLRPKPRLSISDLLVHTVPLSTPPQPSPRVLRTFEGGDHGESPPDRNVTRPWPGFREGDSDE